MKAILTSWGATLLVSTLMLGCAKEKKEEVIIRPVRVVQLQEAGARVKQTLAGVARSSKEMSLSFRVSGTITELNVRLGDAVKANDIIARVDDKDARIDIERAQASVARANAEYRSAQADFERSKLLYADDSVSRADLDASRAQEESKRAMLSAERKSLELAQSRLSDHVLRAPLPGGIAGVPVEVNENVQSGQAIALLNAGDKAEVEVAVPERMIEFFHRDSPAKVRFDTIPGELFDGLVSEVGVASSSGSASFPVRVALLKEDPRIRSGMSALVTLALDDNKGDRLFVPPAGLLEDNQGRHYVMLAEVTEPGFAKVVRRDVKVGEPTSLGITVAQGLSGGERIIVAGLASITEGMKVRLLSRSEPKGAEARIDRAMPPPVVLDPELPEPQEKQAPASKASGAEKGAEK